MSEGSKHCEEYNMESRNNNKFTCSQLQIVYIMKYGICSGRAEH